MRILALEIETAGASAAEFEPHLIEEAKEVWRLYHDGVVREAYFRSDRHTAVLVLECADPEEATLKLSGLPLVTAGLIEFQLIPLAPYSGFSRLFAS